MNKQSNLYTIIYIIVLVLIVGTALAFTAMSLKDKQNENADADKMRQILQSVHVTTNRDDVVATYNQLITDSYVINCDGEKLTGVDAFQINVAQEFKRPECQRQLPIYVCTVDAGTKYIIPLAGMGLWGPIWGYISIDADGKTVYGAFFDHEGETPGLGAEITKPEFSDQFDGKELIKQGKFQPIEVVKKGQHPLSDADYVDGISGGTVTSKGVGAMLESSLAPYKKFLTSLSE